MMTSQNPDFYAFFFTPLVTSQKLHPGSPTFEPKCSKNRERGPNYKWGFLLWSKMTSFVRWRPTWLSLGTHVEHDFRSTHRQTGTHTHTQKHPLSPSVFTMGNQSAKEKDVREKVKTASAGGPSLSLNDKEERTSVDSRRSVAHEDSPFLALCPRTIDHEGFLSTLNSNVRQLDEVNEFVNEFRGNAQIVQEALDLFAAQVLSIVLNLSLSLLLSLSLTLSLSYSLSLSLSLSLTLSLTHYLSLYLLSRLRSSLWKRALSLLSSATAAFPTSPSCGVTTTSNGSLSFIPFVLFAFLFSLPPFFISSFLSSNVFFALSALFVVFLSSVSRSIRRRWLLEGTAAFFRGHSQTVIQWVKFVKRSRQGRRAMWISWITEGMASLFGIDSHCSRFLIVRYCLPSLKSSNIFFLISTLGYSIFLFYSTILQNRQLQRNTFQYVDFCRGLELSSSSSFTDLPLWKQHFFFWTSPIIPSTMW